MFFKRRVVILVKLRFINFIHTIIVNMHSVSYHLDVQELKFKNLIFFPTESTGTEFGDGCRQLIQIRKRKTRTFPTRGIRTAT